MSSIVPIIATSAIPFVSLLSFSVYLTSHPDSPINTLRQGRVALPTTRHEALDGTTVEEKDPFDIVDAAVCNDGDPVGAEQFWKSTFRRKIALLLLLVPPFVCNILLLIFTILSFAGDAASDDKTRAILLPTLLVPAHIVTVILALWYLRQSTTKSHWPTTVHLSIGIAVQMLVLAFLALLPSTPLPRTPTSFSATFIRMDTFALPALTPLNVLTPLLPLLHLPPLLVVLFIRRGPPLYLALDVIYPPKITESVPLQAEALDSSVPNVTQEAQCTVVDWLLFSYATDVVKKGYVSDSMEVWDLPILQANMRESPVRRRLRRANASCRICSPL
jgi:hypothetical protein